MSLSLKRTGNLRGGPGMSANDTQQYLFNAIDEVKNDYTPGTNEWVDFNEKRRLLHIRWKNARNTSTNNESFAEYAAGRSFDRGGKHRRRPSRKYKKSAKRVFRKKSRSTRRR